MASTPTSTSTSKSSTTATATASKPSPLNLSANFAGAHAHSKSQAGNGNPSAVGYDHEIYLQLTAGEKAKEKTPNQVYREERARRRTTRALDRAILEPQGDPSPVDFECAEVQAKRDW